MQFACWITKAQIQTPPPPPPPPPPPSSSAAAALQPWVGLGLLKQMSPATSILGIHPPISTTQFPCTFLYPVNPS